jgi:hypothetical protein
MRNDTPASTENRHRVTLEASRQLVQQEPTAEGFVFSHGTDSFYIQVHHERTTKALEAIDRLAQLCETAGFRFQPGDGPDDRSPGLAIVIGDEYLYPSLIERMRRSPYRPTPAEQARQRREPFHFVPKFSYHPSGELTLTVAGERGTRMQMVLRPKRNVTPEKQLQTIPARLIALADQLREDRHRRALAEERDRQASQARVALRARIEAEEQAVEQLMGEASAWQEAQKLRTYIAAAEVFRSAVWAEWASRQADRLDPLVPSPTSILDTPASHYEDDPYGMWEEELSAATIE